MISCRLDGARRILCIGAHSDDIEIGCGGTVLKLIREDSRREFHWVVFSAESPRDKEARKSAERFLQGASKKRILIREFRASFFPCEWTAIKEDFEKLKEEFQPDLIFTHYRDDRHQDHRVLSDLAWNTFRNHLILEYEIPKYDGDLGIPNSFVPLDPGICRKKVVNLRRFFQTQANKHWFSEETFLGLMRLRGMECASKYAEAFYCRKLVFGTAAKHGKEVKTSSSA